MPRNDRLSELLARWVGADAEGRAVDPATLCADCPELLPEMERICRFDVRLNRLLESVASLDTTVPEETSMPASLSAFPSVPGYIILRELAQGNMGRVFHARAKRLDRDAAVKIVRPERLSADLLARFADEARAIARLDHPHIVHIYEVGECVPPYGGPPVPFLALEYIPGGTLEECAGPKPLPAAEAARIVCLLARAMVHAHARGIVHRDLKPGNILIAAPADEPGLNAAIGRPKISDFGLARQENGLGTRLTTPGAIMGTPAYMSPEQAEGRIDEIGPPSDVYALGAILYRLLTGRVVFESDSALSMLNDVCHTPPRRPSELVAGIPQTLEVLCLRCLAKNPADRPSAAELAAALTAFDPDEGPVAPSEAPIRPRRSRWGLALAVVLALVVLVALLAWNLSQPASDRTLADGPADTHQLTPLKGYLDAQVKRAGDPLNPYIPLRDPASRPLRPDDRIRLYGELNRPAHVYLVWIDSAGTVTPMYLSRDGDSKRLEWRVKEKTFKLPRLDGGWGEWQMGPGKPGLETMVLLCRDDPLPGDVDLVGLLGPFGAQPLAGQDTRAVAWFENGEPVQDEPQRAPLTVPVAGGNPLERLNRAVYRRAKRHFAYTVAITYGNEGDRP